MTLLRVLAVGVFLALIVYTAVVVGSEGPNLFPVFFGDMSKLRWQGQFNLDFMFMLAFSALWVGWRHNFSLSGLLLAALAFLGGAMFLSLYLLVESLRSGSVKALLLGKRA